MPSPTSPAPDSLTEKLPMVDVAEKAHVLEEILRFCYPALPQVALGRAHDIFEFYRAVDKYMIDEAKDYARRVLIFRADALPVNVYAVVCRLGLEKEAIQVARVALGFTLSELVRARDREIDECSVTTLRRLWDYYNSYQARVVSATICDNIALQKMVDNGGRTPDPYYEPGKFPFSRRENATCCMTPQWEPNVIGTYYVKTWLLAYLNDLGSALEGRPCEYAIGVEGMHFDESRCAVKAASCPTCAPIASEILRRYRYEVRYRVGSLLDKVELVFQA